MSTLKKKSKKHSGSSNGSGDSAPDVQLDDKSKRFIYALAAIGGILVAALAILELMK